MTLVGFAKQVGVPLSGGKYVFNLRDGVNWASRLRVIHPTLESAGPAVEVPTITVPPLSTVTLPVLGQPPAESPTSPTSPATPSPSASPGATRSAASLRIGSIRVRGRAGVLVTLSCRGAKGTTCKGSLTLTTVARKPK
ncbi:MAG: hypothetical protein ACRDSN_18555 [Pseudonocardiaceae bacterium]